MILVPLSGMLSFGYLLIASLSLTLAVSLDEKLQFLIPIVKGRRSPRLPSGSDARIFARQLLIDSDFPHDLKLLMAAHFDTELIRGTLKSKLQFFIEEAQECLQEKKSDRKASCLNFKKSADSFHAALVKLGSHVGLTSEVFKRVLGEENLVTRSCLELEPVFDSLSAIAESLTLRNFQVKRTPLSQSSDEYSRLLHGILNNQVDTLENVGMRIGSSITGRSVLDFIRKLLLKEIEFVACFEKHFADLSTFPEVIALQSLLQTMRISSLFVAIGLLRGSGNENRVFIAALESYTAACDTSTDGWKLSETIIYAIMFSRVREFFKD